MVEELINVVYLREFLERKFPNAHILKKVPLGPVELHFKKINKKREDISKII